MSLLYVPSAITRISISRLQLFAVALWTTILPSAQAQMTWEVVNRFPLLSTRAFEEIKKQAGTQPIGIESRLVQIDYRNSVDHLQGSAWSEANQVYDAKRILSPNVEIVGTSSFEGELCRWTLTKEGQDSPLAQHQESCGRSKPFKAEINNEYSIHVVRIADGATDSIKAKPKKHLVVAVGDSFTSGEGNPDYPAVFQKVPRHPSHDWAINGSAQSIEGMKIVSAVWMDATCHRSLLAWPSLYALRVALTRPDTVVQFASFACSGGEVLDGFLLPQRDPPGSIGTELSTQSSYHSISQQRALARFLCGDQELQSETVSLTTRRALWVYQQQYKDNAAIPKIYRCVQPTRPDEVLFQLGGNDTKFSGVVKYVMYPNELMYGNNAGFLKRVGGRLILTPTINRGLYEALKPVTPDEAITFVDRLPEVYGLLNRGFEALDLKGDSVTMKMLLYPDPTVSAYDGDMRIKELMLCNRRTRDGNRPMQSLVAKNLGLFKNDSAIMGISPNRLMAVKSTYIPALRSAQLQAISKYQWQVMDSTDAMVGCGLCAGRLECDEQGKDCVNPNRVRWDYPIGECTHSPDTPPWANLTDFRAYDPGTRRGLRYGNDALLTAVRLSQSNDRVLLDWMTASMHPTASVHARIASKVDVRLLTVSANSPKGEPAILKRMVPPASTYCGTKRIAEN